MGGSINVAIRFSSGEALCIDYWTNSLPTWMLDPRMIEEDEKYIRSWINQYEGIDPKAEWVYGRPTPLCNSEYGLVVWDFMTKSILDNNSYTGLLKRPFISCKPNGRMMQGIRSLIKQGRTRMYHRNYMTGDFYIDPDHDPAFILDQLNRHSGYSLDLGEEQGIVIDYSPLTFFEFPMDSSKGMRKKLREIGFPMSRKEGLNAKKPPLPKYDANMSSTERLARMMFTAMKSSTHQNYRTVYFDHLTEECQEQFMEAAGLLEGTETATILRESQHTDRQITFDIEVVLGKKAYDT